ncbi:MAG: PSD1 and planctomycete cytochrome C domain-containing protein [Verrucomicrobiales bacterium]
MPLLALPWHLTAAEGIQFNRDVRSILADNCFACHGRDAKKRKAKLRLDQRESALADRDGSRAIVPGKPGQSALWSRINAQDMDEVMPPPKSHKALSDTEKDILKRWIEQGAQYQAHWAFMTPAKPQVPKIAGAVNPIDAFLRNRFVRKGLKPAAPAKPETLIRRLFLDLAGLPPTPAEVDAFLADQSPQTWEKLIDQLMDRKTYGEHMARYWLDLARYADTHGLHLDNERSMWPYRDWVVRAFNTNLPFDEFTRWQLAGDLIPDPTLDQRIASGFNRCNVTTGEGGSINAEWIYRNAVDRTSTAVEVWMGLTAGCAVCHDHKFDPLSTKEYYSLYSFFHSAADPALDGNKIDTPPILRVPKQGMLKRQAELDAQIAGVDKRIAAAVSRIKYIDPASLKPPPESEIKEVIWFEDGFPKGKIEATGPPLQLVAREEGPVFSGKLAIRRTAKNATGQDVYSQGKFIVPRDGTFFVHCYLDPKDPPEAVMVQFHVGGWNHRAVWGAHEKIGWGKVNTHQRVDMGSLPEQGKWVRLEFAANMVGLKPGTTVTGYALTQFSGTMGWDHFGISSTTNPSKDPAYSWQAWKAQPEGTRNKDLTADQQKLFKGKAPEKWPKAEEMELRSHWLGRVYLGARKELEPLTAEKAGLEKQKADAGKDTAITFVMADMPNPRQSFVMLRGQYDKPGEKVSRGVPAFLPPLPPRPKERDYNRLDLANWLVSKDHPLTARVAVNRFWQQFFGTGLVRTSADFGTQGELPSNPELLDWLACQFIEDNWDIKRFVKRILTSHAYRQSSRMTPSLLKKDPNNRLLARGPRYRLDAEILRDQALQLSGLLVHKVGGRGVRPYQPPNIWEPVGFASSNTRNYKQGKGDDLYRRSLYTFLKRTAPPPFMTSFDAPSREQSCALRGRSNTPMQALQLMNDIQHVEAARNLAQRILKEGGVNVGERVRWAWRVVTARHPDAQESKIILAVLNGHRARFTGDAGAAEKLIAFGESKADTSLSPNDLAAWTLVANLLLNLDEVINKN